jgi:hypothetical protein
VTSLCCGPEVVLHTYSIIIIIIIIIMHYIKELQKQPYGALRDVLMEAYKTFIIGNSMDDDEEGKTSSANF